MSTSALRERLKQFQALKESAQAKSLAAKAREDEMRTLAERNATKQGLTDEQTAAGETQATAEESAASPAPGSVPAAAAEDKKPEADTGTKSDDAVETVEEEEVIVEEEIVEEEVIEDEVVEEEVVEGDITDEKSVDEFVAEPRALATPSELDDLAELGEVREGGADDAPYDEEGVLPVFRALDEDAKESGSLPLYDSSGGQAKKKRRKRKPDEGLPRGFSDVNGRRWRSVLCCLLVIGVCAITALILPFFVDYDALGRNSTPAPTISPEPSAEPSTSPTQAPSVSQAPSPAPTGSPSASPTVSPAPTANPTESPTEDPTESPTASPTEDPSPSPTQSPTDSPTASPSLAPVDPTPAPTAATDSPTLSPTLSLTEETPVPTTGAPSLAPVTPTVAPVTPTQAPILPTVAPVAPTAAPVEVTAAPVAPTTAPVAPTNAPVSPTIAPVAPTTAPASVVATSSPTTLRLSNFIRVFLTDISGTEVFEDQSSPQFRAAQYIAEEDSYVSQVTDQEEVAERYALATFYFASGGDNWSRCSSEDEDCTGAWLSGNACGWEFLTCNGDGRVTSLTFDGTESIGLSGSIPPELYVLGFLEELVIVDEPISGVLPVQFGEDLTNLRQIVIQGTEIGGTIPDDYLSKSPLESMIMRENNLEGPIPRKAGSKATLTEMDLGGNQLNGPVPDSLGGYTALTTLALDSNLLVGSIPDSVYGMDNLERLYLNNNPLMFGSLSPLIGGMLSLVVFRVGSTGIGGELPRQLFELPALEELDLSGSAFRGPLSPSFGDLSATLKVAKLEGNSFTGEIPASFGDLVNLNVLSLQGNDLVGSMPDEVCQLRGDGPEFLEALSVDCDEVQCPCCTECFF